MSNTGIFVDALTDLQRQGWLALSKQDRGEIIQKLEAHQEDPEAIRAFLEVIARQEEPPAQ